MPRRGLTKRQKREINNFAMSHWKVLLAVFLLLVILCVVAYYLGWFELLKGYFRDDTDDAPILSTAGGYETTVDSLEDLEVAFLDIGQGDCIIIELPDGKNMIIDSGDDNDDQKVIANYATANNITTFDYLLLTHQDADHVGNMNWVIDEYTVRYIFRPNNYSSHSYSSGLPVEFNPVIDNEDAVSTTKAYAEFMVSAYNEKCTVEIFNKDSDFTNTIVCGETRLTYTFNFLTPTAKREEIIYSNKNDYSPILMLEYAGKRIVFTGDAELDALEEYINIYDDDYNVDVLKVGHHGSSNATTSEFVSKIDPEYAVIQCEKGNDYGHPHKSVLNVFADHDGGVDVYRNDTNGTIVLGVNNVGQMFWSFEKSDMTYNGYSGEELEAIKLNALKPVHIIEEIALLWKDCFYDFDFKKSVTN